MLAFLSKPVMKWGLAVLAAVGLIVGVQWYVESVRREGFKAGKTEAESQVKTNTIIIQREIQRAEDRGPRTRRDVSDSLRAGTF